MKATYKAASLLRKELARRRAERLILALPSHVYVAAVDPEARDFEITVDGTFDLNKALREAV